MPPIDDLFTNISIATIAITCISALCITVFSIGLTVVIWRYVRKKVGPDQEILQRGTPARARILSVQQTGVSVNDSPQVLLQLEIQPQYGAPYQAATKAVIPIVHIPQFQPGAEVPVMVHPTDPTKVELDFRPR
jgi:hypothetical protein